MRNLTVVCVLVAALAACGTNKWVLKNPPKTCAAMCDSWGMELAAVVGVGEQTRSEGGQGATACVCQPRGATALTQPELSAVGYAAIPPEIRDRQAAAAQQQRNNQANTPRK